jgi:hypothetical protein
MRVAGIVLTSGKKFMLTDLTRMGQLHGHNREWCSGAIVPAGRTQGAGRMAT